jgi:dephospho-CoA kinase
MQGVIIFGQMGSGKDTVADMLREYGYTTAKIGKYIRENVDKYNYAFENKRPLYQQYGQMCRQLFGENVWNETLKNDIKILSVQHGISNFAIADGRQLNEFEYWKSRGFLTVGILADANIRDKRLIERDGISQKQYFDHQTEIEAMECIQRCSYIVNNNESFEFLKAQIDMIVKMID